MTNDDQGRVFHDSNGIAIEDYTSTEPLLLEPDKPQNLIISQSNEQNWIKLSD